jgi:hypothetical protein
MSSIGIIHTTVGTEVASTSTSFTEVVESAALTGGTTYYVICHALVEGTSNSKVFEWRLVDRTNSDTVLSNSTTIREPAESNKTQGYEFVGKFTTGSGGRGLAFEQKAPDVFEEVRTQYLSMVILDLDNMDINDYFYNNNTTTTALTNSFQSFATHTTTPTASDDWLVFGWQSTQIDDITHSTEIKLFCSDASGSTDVPLISFEAEDLTEQSNNWLCRAYTMTGAESTWSIKSRMDATTATPNDHLESTIFGLRLSAFVNHNYGYTASLVTTSTGWTELDSNALTPDSTGDVIAVAFSAFDAGSTLRRSFQRIQVDGTTSPNSRPTYEFACISNDSTDVLGMPYITNYSGIKDTSKTVDLDAKKQSSAEYGWLTYTLAQFTAEIIPIAPTAPINYSAVATQTFASGDVASESYNSGDVASETFNSGDVASEVNPE